MNATATTLRDAIDRSQSHNEIVHVEWDGGDLPTLLAELGAIHDGEVDWASENNGTYDVWGIPESDPEGEMVWRLNVTMTPIFGRRTGTDNNVRLFNHDGTDATCLGDRGSSVYPIDSDKSAAYDHPEGIVIDDNDAVRLGIEIEN